MCQVRSGLRISGMVLLSLCVTCILIFAVRVPGGTMCGSEARYPVEMTVNAVGIYSWLAAPICLLVNQGLWFWCRRTHRERASLRSLALLAIWFVVGYFVIWVLGEVIIA